MDYTALNLSMFVLFSCTRIALWSAIPGYNSSYQKQIDRQMCAQVKEAIRIYNCKPATQSEFDAWCWQMFNSADRIDCQAMKASEQMMIRKRMKRCA